MTYAQICRIAESQSADEAFAIGAENFAALGFSRINYGLTRYNADASIGDPADVLFLSTSPPEYATLLFAGGLYRRSPIFRWAQENHGACTWDWVRRDMEAGTLPPGEVEAVKLNATFGVVAGIAFSFGPTHSAERAVLGLTAEPHLTHDDVECLWAAHRDPISALAHMMHLRIATLPSPDTRQLTPRQCEVLAWVADGKTMQDIAQLLGVSIATVEKHLRLAREAMAVETTAQAVAKGLRLNLIPSTRRP